MTRNEIISFVNKKIKRLKRVKEEEMSGSKTRKFIGRRRNRKEITGVLAQTIEYVMSSQTLYFICIIIVAAAVRSRCSKGRDKTDFRFGALLFSRLMWYTRVFFFYASTLSSRAEYIFTLGHISFGASVVRRRTE